MQFNTKNHTGILIKKAARLLEQVANRDLDKLGVTYAQTIFLIRLWEEDGQTQKMLTKSAGLKQPTVVRLLDRMERDQLVKRVCNKDDRRVFNFYLTPKAKKICAQLESHVNVMDEISSHFISQQEIKQLNILVCRLIDNLESFLAKN